VSPKPAVVIVDGGILRAILQALTRYSANDRQFPVNDWSLFTGVPATGKCSFMALRLRTHVETNKQSSDRFSFPYSMRHY
jgi:hypothetical protein